nr:hypothetical protein BaRGS_025797 [Batillaria attramentaria]
MNRLTTGDYAHTIKYCPMSDKVDHVLIMEARRTGDYAHTIKYCPVSDKVDHALIMEARRVGVQTSQPIATKFAMSLEGHLEENKG